MTHILTYPIGASVTLADLEDNPHPILHKLRAAEPVSWLPVLDGWEATRAIKADPDTAAIPVIALTAHAMGADRDKALEAGCDEFHTKPVDLPGLLTKIGRLIPD